MLSIVVSVPAVLAADKAGASDHPMIRRYEGSQIVDYQQTTFDEYVLPLGRAIGKDSLEKSETVRGKITRIQYETDKQRSPLEVYSNYEQALQKAGFTALWQCAEQTCGSDKDKNRKFNLAVGEYRWHGEHTDDQRYLSAKLARSEGDIYVSLYVTRAYGIGGARKDKIYTQLIIIESKPMETGKVVVDANAMLRGITEQGRIALYGIYFDTDKATLKPESNATLAQIAQLLREQTALKLIVVGHTDSAGDFQHNLSLSKQRAQAVMAALINNYGIAAARLRAEGVAYLAPTASNRHDQGRAQNRRVELIEQ
jgi:outer membrane protein OmpA-like peptidoglycan-associated protein